MPRTTMTMRFYTQPRRFYCGVHLHARTMYLCILDDQGRVVYDQNLPARADTFLAAVEPFRDGLVVAEPPAAVGIEDHQFAVHQRPRRHVRASYGPDGER